MSERPLIHPEAEQAAAYALGALDAREIADFEAHLAGCTTCRDAVAEYRAVADRLALAAPAVTPPPGLKDRVLREAREAAPLAKDRLVAIPMPPRRAVLAPWLLAAASLFVAAALAWQLQRERERARAINGALLAAELRAREAESLASQRDSLLQIVLAPSATVTRLSATGQPPSLRLTWNAEARVIVVSARDLPPAAAGRIYQLWGLPVRGVPVSLGTFNTAPDGQGYVVLRVPGELPVLNGSAVTEEPGGGSPQPTSAPFLVGPWS